MRKALAYVLLAAAVGSFTSAAERKSWNKVRYLGGTASIRGGSYDWDTTVAITSNPDAVEVAVAASSAFAHPQTLRLRPSQITSLIYGSGAWQRAAAVPGTHLPAKPHGLFGVLNRGYPIIGRPYGFLAILYDGDDGKPAAILLDCDVPTRTQLALGKALAARAGKALIYAK